jgi:hypothetical protein
MTNVLNLINELKSNSGKNAKIEILSKYADDELVKGVFDAAMNPYRVYGIKQLPDIDRNTGDYTLNDFLMNLTRFEERIVTGNEAKHVLKTLLEGLSPDDAEVAKLIILKDLNCGTGPSIVNSAIPKLIPVYPCMKASSQSEKSMQKINYPAISQIKADGMRANLILTKRSIEFRGRSGKVIDLLDSFSDIEFPIYVSTTGAMLDGELRVLNDDGTWMSRKKGNGILNKAIKGTISEEEVKNVRFIAWDLIPWSEFTSPVKKADENAMPYMSRWKLLEQTLKDVNDDRMQLIESVKVENEEEAFEHYLQARKN